jgi:hypothetical protein
MNETRIETVERISIIITRLKDRVNAFIHNVSSVFIQWVDFVWLSVISDWTEDGWLGWDEGWG